MHPYILAVATAAVCAAFVPSAAGAGVRHTVTNLYAYDAPAGGSLDSNNAGQAGGRQFINACVVLPERK